MKITQVAVLLESTSETLTRIVSAEIAPGIRTYIVGNVSKPLTEHMFFFTRSCAFSYYKEQFGEGEEGSVTQARTYKEVEEFLFQVAPDDATAQMMNTAEWQLQTMAEYFREIKALKKFPELVLDVKGRFVIEVKLAPNQNYMSRLIATPEGIYWTTYKVSEKIPRLLGRTTIATVIQPADAAERVGRHLVDMTIDDF